MARSISLVRVNVIFPFISYLDRFAIPKQQILQAARIPVSTLNNPENLVPLALVCQFIESIARCAGKETLGIEVGLNTSLGQLGAFGRLIRHSFTLYELLRTAEKLVPLYCSGDNLRICCQEDKAWLYYYSFRSNNYFSQHEIHYLMMHCLNSIRLVADRDWQPSEICLMSRENSFWHEIQLFSNTHFQFNHPKIAISFPKAYLSRPIHYCSGYDRFNQLQDINILQLTSPALEFPVATQQVLKFLLPQGYPVIELVAEIAGMNVRSFQRRLAENGLSYSRLVEKVRFDEAINNLQDSEMKINEIALELGYRDPANFTRAFKRWTGISPQDFREQRCNG